MTRYCTLIESPVGRLYLAADAEALTELRYHSKMGSKDTEGDWRVSPAPFREPIRQLMAYFRGRSNLFLFQGKAEEVRSAPETRGDALSKEGMEGAAGYTLRGDPLLQGGGPSYRKTRSDPRRGSRQRPKSPLHRHSLSPRDRERGQADRVWRRPGCEALPPRAGRRPVQDMNERSPDRSGLLLS